MKTTITGINITCMIIWYYMLELKASFSFCTFPKCLLFMLLMICGEVMKHSSNTRGIK